MNSSHAVLSNSIKYLQLFLDLFQFNLFHNFILDSWSTPIDKLMIWRVNWTKYNPKMSNLVLRVHYDQLLLTADTKILESFNMHYKIKGIYKEDVLILIVHNFCKEVSSWCTFAF